MMISQILISSYQVSLLEKFNKGLLWDSNQKYFWQMRVF